MTTKNPANDSVKLPDPIKLSRALLDVYEKSQPIFKEFIEHQNQDTSNKNFDPLNIKDVYIEFLEKLFDDPEKFWQNQAVLWGQWMHLWHESTLKFLGENGKTLIEPEKGDRRFKAPEWQESAVFDFLKQSYLLTAKWMEETVRDTQGLDAHKKEKLAFHTRLFANALSPSNFMMTNPEVIKETLNSGGENLIKGLENLVNDMKRGHGDLKISMTDYDAFELGKNIAVTPGQVVYQNDLMQLIQYEPSTKKVHKTPLLIIPPWINKYYILDLREENSFIKWAVDQGHTVFTISWVNPDKKLAQKRFEDYMEEGVLDALTQVENITGEKQTNVIGYCLGGTLLTITLSYLQAKKQANRVKSATFFTTLIDFEDAGDLKLFVDDEQLELLDREMAEKGVLEGKQLQRAFSLLRANDLIWSFVVNNYLMGREPFPFDLLYWNDDPTNMPAAMHSFYLRKMYQENALIQPGGISMNDVGIDVGTIKTPAYFLSTKEDHITPWMATYSGAQKFSGDVTFTLAASGHIAGVINPPQKNKYCYWSSAKLPTGAQDWLSGTKEQEGSWWPHWQTWIATRAGEKIPARAIKNPLEPAPGSYVKVKGG